MKKPLRSSVFRYVVLPAYLFSLSAFASIESEFEALKNSGEDYRPDGAVCEQVARLDVAEKYPESQYEVTTGIVYGTQSQTIGELDVVVLRKSDGKAVLIAEVKCMRDLSRARKKASDQRERFLRTMQNQPGGLRLYKKNRTFEIAQFRDAKEFIAIAQLGAKSYGFEQDLDYTLDEMRMLRQQLLRCQGSGRCRAPAN